MSMINGNGRVISNGHAPLSTDVITSLRRLPKAQLQVAAQGYVNAHLLGELRDAYIKKTGHDLRRKMIVQASSAKVAFEAQSILVTVRAELSQAGGGKIAGRGVDISLRFEGEGLRKFAAEAEQVPAPVVGNEPDIVVRRRR